MVSKDQFSSTHVSLFIKMQSTQDPIQTLTAVPIDAGASKEEKLAPDFVDRALWYNLAIPIRQLQSRSLELDLSNILWRVQLQVHRFRIWRPIAFSSNLLFFFSRQRSDCKRYTPDRITQPSILPFLMQNGNSTWMQEKLVQVCSSRIRSEILYQTYHSQILGFDAIW